MSLGARQLIYFCGSMRAGRQDVQLYGNLVAALGRWGEVLTPFVADPSITEVDSEYEGGDLAIHERTMGLLQRADVVYKLQTFAFIRCENRLSRQTL